MAEGWQKHGTVDYLVSLQDEHGPRLSPKLRDIQIKHKQHLLKKTQFLVEPRLQESCTTSKKFPIEARYVNLTVVSTDRIEELTQNEVIDTGVRHKEFLEDFTCQSHINVIKHKQHLRKETQFLVEPRLQEPSLTPQRFPIKEHNVNLSVELTQNEKTDRGVRHKFLKDTKLRLKHFFSKRLFNWNRQSQCVSHAVMVSGVSGIGKTTLMQKLVYDWVNGELYQRFTFVFFFKFRELNSLKEISLEKMILKQYPHLERQIGNILQDPERLLFIFDGLDESVHQIDFSSSKLCIHPKHVEELGVVVVSLVRQTLLKGCSILITSRPTRLASINTGVFQKMTEIIGFLHTDQLIYFKNFLENQELSEKIFPYLQENETLKTFCYIPAYCWIVCTVLSVCFKAHPTNTDQLLASLPKTLTQLFVTFVSNILTNSSDKKDNSRTKDLLTSIGWMAEHGVMNLMNLFDERHLASFNVRTDHNLFSRFMMESGQPPDVVYSFFHVTLQAFYAALVHFINYSPGRLQKSLDRAERYKDGRAEIFLCFLCGLTDSSTRSMLEPHVGELSAQASGHVISWLQEKTTKGKKYYRCIMVTRELFNVFNYLHEIRNEELVLQCIGARTDIHFSEVNLTSVDCFLLSFILESSKKVENLALMGCNIQNEALRKLVPAYHNIKSLRLCHNDLTDSSCPHLASGIRNNKILRRLDLFGNNLEGPRFKDLMTALTTSRIEELQLGDNHLTHRSCPHLASGIRHNQTLRELNLSWNNLEGPHFSDLMKALTTSRIEVLSLNDINLTDDSCTHLASGIRNHQTLRCISLSSNNLGVPHFGDLMAALSTSRIKIFILYYVQLTDEFAPFLVLLSNCTNLTHVDLFDNYLTDASAVYIQDLIVMSDSLQSISIWANKFSTEAEKFLAQIKPEMRVDGSSRFVGRVSSAEHKGDMAKSEHSAEVEEQPVNLVYRLDVQPGQLCCCSETGIKFQVESQATITYELKFQSDNVNKIKANGYDIVGPMFDISVEPGVVSAVHLPHYLNLNGQIDPLIRCGSFKDGKIQILKPKTIGPSHLVLENPSFCGLVPLISKLWSDPIPLNGQALLYGKVVCPEDTNDMEYKFHLYLIPQNHPEAEVMKLQELKERSGFKDMEKPAIVNYGLYTKRTYKIEVQPKATIKREFLELELPNILNVEVNLDREATQISLCVFMMGRGDPVWKCHVTEGELKEMQLRARASVSNGGSSPSTNHFVDRHQVELIDGVHPVGPVLDKLRVLELLTIEQCSNVSSKPTSQDKMRELYLYIRVWGDENKDKLLHTLEETNKSFINDLRRQ